MQEEESHHKLDHWKRSIRELPEDLFFSIMRTYLGRLSTPFHKHDLAERLAVFLSKEETVQRILELVDREDARILTAVDLLAGAGAAELYRLLEDEYDYFSFHSLLLNLQERLLIYSEAESGALYLTPQLAPTLRREVLAASLLFPVQPEEAGGSLSALSADAPWLREELLWALVSFFRDNPQPFKHSGELRKKQREELERVFPIFSGEEGDVRIALLLKAAWRLGLYQRRENRVKINRNRMKDFAAQSRRARHLLLWAAAALSDDESAAELADAAGIIGELLSAMPRGKVSAGILRRLISTISFRRGGALQSGIKPSLLCDIGLIDSDGSSYRKQHLSVSLIEQEEVQKPLILHSDFTATAAPPLSFSTGIFLADLFKLRMFTVYPQLELTKSSFTACRMHFKDFEQFIARLEQLSSSSLPPNIRVSLSNWEENYSGVSLNRGIVLQIDSDRKHLVEHNDELADRMLAVLADGVYLFRDDEPETLLQLLAAAGIDPLPPLGPRSMQHAPPAASERSFFPVIHQDQEELQLERGPRKSPRPVAEAREDGELQKRIQGLETDESTREALGRLVEKKVIIFPSQVRSDLQLQKLSEARGIDYAGKVRVIEETMRSEWDVLELVERDPRGNPLRHLLRPVKLQKMGNDLLLYGREFPEMEEIKLRVRKLSYVRRWRNSLIIHQQEHPNR